MKVSSIFVILLMWIVAFMGLGASCTFVKDGLCALYLFSLESIVWTILGIFAAIFTVTYGAMYAEDKWDKKIDLVSGFALSFIVFWSVYSLIVRYILL